MWTVSLPRLLIPRMVSAPTLKFVCLENSSGPLLPAGGRGNFGLPDDYTGAKAFDIGSPLRPLPWFNCP